MKTLARMKRDMVEDRIMVITLSRCPAVGVVGSIDRYTGRDESEANQQQRRNVRQRLEPLRQE
jgi:hypothetical protein